VPLTPSQFAARWRIASLSERSGAQSHFIDLCDMLGEAHPAAADSVGERFTFEKSVSRTSGGKGFADVWLRDHFAWEYKGKHKNLGAAYRQLNDYREDLLNPPLLVVCDMNCFEVHTNFGKTKKRVYKFDLRDIELNQVTADCPLPPLEVLHALYHETDRLRPERTDAFVTQEAAKIFARMAERLEIEKRSLTDSPIATREEIAHFLLRLLFCLFADNIGLLPNHVFRRLIESEDRFTPRIFLRKLRNLFQAMAEPDGIFGEHTIKHFNGGLFDSASIIDLDKTDLGLLHHVATRYDWAHVAPAIFGTLFERSLDPSRRSLIGAHYTSEADILLLVEPIVIQPIRARWEQTKDSILTILERAESASTDAITRGGQDFNCTKQRQKRRGTLASGSLFDSKPEVEKLLAGFFDQISSVRVLDPACGSGNFLYVALRKLLDLWLEARDFAIHHNIQLGIQYAADHMVSPSQLLGIEVEFYAHGLASVVVWIGFLQWKIEHGILIDRQPILQKLTNIEHADAILRYDEQTNQPYEPAWPSADFIIGNPPFLGGKLLRRTLGDTYVDILFKLYKGRVKAESDLVVYWFEKARHQLANTSVNRVGLLATQGIRGGANRAVLERIQETGRIFWAWSDRKWTLAGAAVHVSMVAFERSAEESGAPHLTSEILDCVLDGQPVPFINPDLTTGSNAASAMRLKENANLCFMGTTKVGPFDIDAETARKMLAAPTNPNGRPNSDVVRPWVNATDITRRPRDMYIIDFGTEITEAEAALYEIPFEYVRHHVKPGRESNNRDAYAKRWWIHGEARIELRRAMKEISRYILTSRVSKHRLFTWLPTSTLPDSATFAIARDDDYFFGILHSSVHEVWARAQGTQLREVESGFRYTPDSTFDTFPFPYAPGTEALEHESPIMRDIAEAARNLVQLRNAWLNPLDLPRAELKERTLTNLYNKRPTWLENAHQTLDRAVFAAYGLAYPLTTNEIIRHLLALNRERAAGHVRIVSHDLPPKKLPGVERLPYRKPSVKFGTK
jgi:type II restriction/modification system DNA methylase subunit YeeA